MQKNKALFAVKQAYSIKAQMAIIRQLSAIFGVYRLWAFSMVKRLQIGRFVLLPVAFPFLIQLEVYTEMRFKWLYIGCYVAFLVYIDIC